MFFLPNSIQDSTPLSNAELDTLWKDFILPRAGTDPLAIVDSFYCALRYERPKSDWIDYSLLEILYPHLTVQQQKMVQTGLLTLEDVETRINTLLKFFPLWDEEQCRSLIPSILQDTLTLEPLTRCRVLPELAQLSSDSQRESVIDAMLDTASSMTPDGENEYLRIEALCQFFPFLNSEAQDAILDSLLTTDEYIENGGFQRSWYLGYVRDQEGNLTEAQIRRVIDHLDQFGGYDFAVVRGVLPLIPKLDFETAQVILNRFDDLEWRVSAMELCVGKFAEIMPEFVRQTARELIESPHIRSKNRSLCSFLPYVSPEERATIVQYLLDIAASADDTNMPREIYLDLAPFLTLEKRSEIFMRLSDIMRTSSWPLNVLIRHMPYMSRDELWTAFGKISEYQVAYRVLLLSAFLQTAIADQIPATTLWFNTTEFFSQTRTRELSLREYLDLCHYVLVGWLDTSRNILTPQFFPKEILQGLGECLIQSLL